MKRNIFFTGALSILLLVTPMQSVHAGVWGESIASSLGKFALEEVRNILYELGKASLDILKTRATTNYLARAAFGDSPAYITDYQEYLFDKPLNAAVVSSEQYLTKALHGRTEGNYKRDDNAGTLESFDSVLYRVAARSIPTLISDENRDKSGVDYIDSCQLVQGQPEFFGVEDDRSFTCFSAMFENVLNHPEGIKAAAKNAYLETKAEQEKIASTNALQAEGVLPQTNGSGEIIKTASAVKNNINKLFDTPTDFLANIQTQHPIAQIIIQEASASLIKIGEQKILEETRRLRQRGERELERFQYRANTADPGR